MKQKVLKIKGLESHSKYNAFIDYSFNKCTAFMLVYINYNGKGYSKEKKEFRKKLKSFEIKRRRNPSWPGVPYTFSNKTEYCIVFYRTTPEAKQILKEKTSLFDWSSPSSPEDLAFFVGDMCWFYSVGHESLAFCIHPDVNDNCFFANNELIDYSNYYDYYYDQFNEKGLETGNNNPDMK